MQGRHMKGRSGHGAANGKTVRRTGNETGIDMRALPETEGPKGASMPDARETKSLAVLIDADNTSAKHAQAIFDEIVKLGEANVRRIYGDFSGTRLAGWDKAIQSLAILQHQQRSNSKGKNASDIALVIDAMDLMYKRTLDGVVSGQLGQRLHASRPAPARGRPGGVRLR